MKLSNSFLAILASSGILLLTSQSIYADVIYKESFTAGVAGPSTSFIGKGTAGTVTNPDIWDFVSVTGSVTTPSLGYALGSNDGAVWGGRDLNGNFGGQGGSNAQRFITIEDFDLSAETNISVSIQLSALPRIRFEAEDFIKLFYRNKDTDLWTIVDVFSGPATGSGLLSNGSVDLGSSFQTMKYKIPLLAATSFGFQVQAFTEGSVEALALDNITIATVSEPTVLTILSIGLLGFCFSPRKKLKNC